MAPLTRRIAHDDDEVFDDAIYDRRYFPRRVYKDGCGPRVRLMLTDSAPPPCAVFDASAHRPRYAVVDRADPHVMAAERAYADHNAYLRDAWKTMPLGVGGADHTTAAGADQPDPDDGDLSPRDQYIARLRNAYRTPIGGPGAAANSIEAQRQRWLKPGARPGTTKDAAISDRDQAYAGYLDRLTNGWRK